MYISVRGDKMKLSNIYINGCKYLNESQRDELDIEDIRFINMIESDVVEFMKKMGVRTNLNGYRYLKESIYLELLKDTKYYVREKAALIKVIADENHTEKTNIERSMKYAIQDLIKNRDYRELNKILGCNAFSKHKIPTNLEFIFYAVEKIRNTKINKILCRN